MVFRSVGFMKVSLSMIIIPRWGSFPIEAMINIIAWSVRGLNSANKQFEVAHALTSHNIRLFGLLETKIKRSGLGPLYHRLCYNWCLTSNLSWY